MSTGKYTLAKTALSRIPHPVVIVGAAAGAERSCATSTCMYVSLAPAMVAVTTQPASRTHRLIHESGEFSVSILDAAQQSIAMAAGNPAPGPDKFANLNIPMLEPPEGFVAPAVAGSIAVLWCRVVNREPTGDQVLFVGEVVTHRSDPVKVDALLRYRRRYLKVGEWTSDVAPEGYPT